MQRPFAPDCPAHRHHRCGAEQADLHAWRAKRGAFLGESQIARGDQLTAGGGCDAAHPGDDRLRDALDGLHHLDALVEDLLILARGTVDQFGQVVARRENRARRGQDDDPNVGAAADVGQGARELLHQLERQRVSLLGSVQRDSSDPFRLIDVDSQHESSRRPQLAARVSPTDEGQFEPSGSVRRPRRTPRVVHRLVCRRAIASPSARLRSS